MHNQKPFCGDPGDPGKSLKKRYIVAVGLLALLIVCSQCIVQYSLYLQKTDARVINIAGRQRMLSQRIAKESLAILRSSDAEQYAQHVNAFRAAVPLWSASHSGLQHGNLEMQIEGRNSTDIAARFTELNAYFEPMLAAAQRLIQLFEAQDMQTLDRRSANREANIILDMEQHFLPIMDDMVFIYDAEAQHKLARLKILELSLTCATLLLLVLEVLFIYAPAGRALSRQFQQMSTSAKELKKRQEEAEELVRVAESAVEAKSEFLANMSHEIRTPLHGVLGLADILLDTELDPAQRNYTDLLKYSGETLLSLVNDILDYSKIEAGKLDFEEIDFDLTQLIQKTCAIMQFKTQTKGLSFTRNIDPDVPALLNGDPGRLRQVLTNVLSNAIKFTETGSVSLQCIVEKHMGSRYKLRFSVCDTGIGIPADKLAGLFDKFTQLDSSTTRKYGGTGLGLAISNHLVSLMDGSMGAESNENHGSTFWFSVVLKKATGFPQALANPPVTAPIQPPTITDSERSCPVALTMDRELSPSQTNILLVEDNLVNQMVVKIMLKKLGYDPDVAANGAEAVQMCNNKKYDLIFMDLQMPVMGGIAATQIIRRLPLSTQSNRNTPIIAMTANAMKGTREECIHNGMNDYITKPVKATMIPSVLAAWLG